MGVSEYESMPMRTSDTSAVIISVQVSSSATQQLGRVSVMVKASDKRRVMGGRMHPAVRPGEVLDIPYVAWPASMSVDSISLAASDTQLVVAQRMGVQLKLMWGSNRVPQQAWESLQMTVDDGTQVVLRNTADARVGAAVLSTVDENVHQMAGSLLCVLVTLAVVAAIS